MMRGGAMRCTKNAAGVGKTAAVVTRAQHQDGNGAEEQERRGSAASARANSGEMPETKLMPETELILVEAENSPRNGAGVVACVQGAHAGSALGCDTRTQARRESAACLGQMPTRVSARSVVVTAATPLSHEPVGARLSKSTRSARSHATCSKDGTARGNDSARRGNDGQYRTVVIRQPSVGARPATAGSLWSGHGGRWPAAGRNRGREGVRSVGVAAQVGRGRAGSKSDRALPTRAARARNAHEREGLVLVARDGKGCGPVLAGPQREGGGGAGGLEPASHGCKKKSEPSHGWHEAEDRGDGTAATSPAPAPVHDAHHEALLEAPENWRCSGLRVSDLGLSDGGMASDGICGRIPLIHPSEASARCSVHPCETPRLSGRSERCSRALAPTHSADWREGGATLGSSATASRFIESADTSVTGGCKDCGALRTELQTALALLCDARERVRAREREVLALQHQHAHERARIREHYEALLRPLLQQNRHGHVCYSEPMEGVTHEHAHGRALAVAEVSHLEPQAHVPSSLCFPPAQGDSASLGHGARDAVWEAPLLLRGDSESEVPESKPLALAPLPLSPPLSPFSEDERAVVLTPLRSRGGGSSA